jgi:hypothetical protein
VDAALAAAAMIIMTVSNTVVSDNICALKEIPKFSVKSWISQVLTINGFTSYGRLD